MTVCGIIYNNRRGLLLGLLLIEQGSSSRGPGGGRHRQAPLHPFKH
jgi:hypothetical protein